MERLFGFRESWRSCETLVLIMRGCLYCFHFQVCGEGWVAHIRRNGCIRMFIRCCRKEKKGKPSVACGHFFVFKSKTRLLDIAEVNKRSQRH
jgi:hypothetical protein